MARPGLWMVFLVGCGGFGNAYSASDAVAKIRCERAFECIGLYPEDSTSSHESLYGDDEAACRARLGPDPARKDSWKSSEDSGTLSYDKDAAKSCASELDALSCEAFFTEAAPAACEDAVTGTEPLDASCRIDAVCASGLCREGRCAGNPE